ncbi:hypothetical protein H2203_006320 [Taxawa tesnikishii (nom. ined.)]|nr:hypothetical protein H2203_006320 [Dothideales sp. JES 119]
MGIQACPKKYAHSCGQCHRSDPNDEKNRHINVVFKFLPAICLPSDDITIRDGGSFYVRLKRAYQWHTIEYAITATLANGLLWLQIIFGAALTALGSVKTTRASTSIIILGAFQTVIAGLLTYFKGRNQPHRAKRFRDDLRRCLEEVENVHAKLNDGDSTLKVRAEFQRLLDMYKDARKTAESNEPEMWTQPNDLEQGRTNASRGQTSEGDEQHGTGSVPTQQNYSGPRTDPVANTAPPSMHGNSTNSQNDSHTA